MASDPYNQDVCMDYIMLLIIMKEYGKAEKLIDFTLSFKGVDLGRLYHLVGLHCEYQHQYDKAIVYYEDSLLEAYNDKVTEFLEGEIKRVKSKQKLRNKPAPGKRRSRKAK
jgi:hypothetical protein